MITTAYKKIGDNEKMRVTYGMEKLRGNEYAYFSITAESKTLGGKELCGGCMHEEIRAHFPELSHLIKWHLVDENGLPMHYLENGKYWWGQWARQIGIDPGFKTWKIRPHNPRGADAFANTVLLGQLDVDKNAAWKPGEVSWSTVEDQLKRRANILAWKFDEVMQWVDE